MDGFPDLSDAKAAAKANALCLSPGAPLVSAREFLRRNFTVANLRTLHHQNAMFYRWDRTHYVEAAFEEVRSGLYRFLDEAVRPTGKEGETAPFAPNKSKVANVIEALAAVGQLPNAARPPSWLDDRGLSCSVRIDLLHGTVFFTCRHAR